MDLDLVKGARFKPAEPSPEERDLISNVKLVDYSIYTKKLQLACRESREVLKRLGISTFITAGDVAHGIYTVNGDLSIAEVGTYMHVVTGILPIKFVLKHYANDPTVGLKDGDVFFCNEAIYGGIHNPDMITFLPVFADDRLIAWVSSASHEPETGATDAGGMPGSAKTRYDEGLKVPPIKVGENFKLRTDLVELIENNVRYPLMITNDHASRIAACIRLRKRLLEIVQQKDKEFVLGLLQKIILDTADVVKKRIARIPDGVFRHVTFMDAIGHQEGLVRLPVALIKRGDNITFDFRHASPQVPGPYNTFEHAVEAHLACVIFQYFLNDVPASAGCLAPFEIKTTPGSCLNASIEAAISNVSFILPTLVNAVQILIVKALFSIPEFQKDEYIALPASGSIGGFGISGLNQWKRHVTAILLAHGNSLGGGARLSRDGVDSLGFWFSGFAEAVDCEQEESMNPITILWRSYVVDGGGHGKFRGGTGVSFGNMIKNTNRLFVMSNGGGCRFPPTQGIFGGYPASTKHTLYFKEGFDPIFRSKRTPRNEVELVDEYFDKSDLQILPSSMPGFNMSEGDIFSKPSGGGGGYGDVLERIPELVLEDVALGKISHWVAKNIYRVEYDISTSSLDRKATERARKEENKARLRRGRPYREFVRDWIEKSPRTSILQFYGDWPIPFIQGFA